MENPFLSRLALWYHSSAAQRFSTREQFDAIYQAKGVFAHYNRAMDLGSETPVLVSACLLGEPCRYDGKSAPCTAITELAKDREFVPVCPEVLGGLPTPRTPAEIQADGRVVDADGNDRTAAFEVGACEALRIAREHGCTQAILKENSPSCGVHHIYNGAFSGILVPGMGKTASLLVEAGIEAFSEADL